MQPPPHFGLIVLGDEILSGRRSDKHLSKTIEILQKRGLSLSWAHYLGDDPQAITALLKQVFASGDIVFSTGGIGSTPDDRTRSCTAQALGLPLERHPEAKALIMQRAQTIAKEKGEVFNPQSPTMEQRLQMADFPKGSRIISNPYNQIPGFSCGLNMQAHFVPGFPVMAWPMIEWVLDQYYSDFFHTQTMHELTLIITHTMEAALNPLMLAIEQQFASVSVFSLPSVDHPEYGPHIELGVKGPDLSQVEAAFTALQQQLDQSQTPWKETIGTHRANDGSSEHSAAGSTLLNAN